MAAREVDQRLRGMSGPEVEWVLGSSVVGFAGFRIVGLWFRA